MRIFIAASRLLTSFSICTFDSAGKYSATYVRPIASPRALSADETARFHRGRCSFAPERNFERNSHSVSAKDFERKGAALSTTANACQAFSVSIGVAAITAAVFGNAVFCVTTIFVTLARPTSLKEARHG